MEPKSSRKSVYLILGAAVATVAIVLFEIFRVVRTLA